MPFAFCVNFHFRREYLRFFFSGSKTDEEEESKKKSLGKKKEDARSVMSNAPNQQSNQDFQATGANSIPLLGGNNTPTTNNNFATRQSGGSTMNSMNSMNPITSQPIIIPAMFPQQTSAPIMGGGIPFQQSQWAPHQGSNTNYPPSSLYQGIPPPMSFQKYGNGPDRPFDRSFERSFDRPQFERMNDRMNDGPEYLERPFAGERHNERFGRNPQPNNNNGDSEDNPAKHCFEGTRAERPRSEGPLAGMLKGHGKESKGFKIVLCLLGFY